MRKLIALALALIVAAGLAAPASGDPHLRRREIAYADWMFPTKHKNEFKWLGAWVWRTTDIPKTKRRFSFAGFVRGLCTRERTPDYVMVDCVSRDLIRGRANRDFEMSPLALDAELRIRHRRRTHVVRWRGQPSPNGLSIQGEACYSVKKGEAEKEGEGHGAGIWNRAGATGHFLGRRFRRPGQVRAAALITDVMASTCSFRDVRYDRDTGTLHVTTRLPR